MRKGRHWMVQWGWPIFFSLGLHVDPRIWYVDLHVIATILTFGNLDAVDYDFKAWNSSRSVDAGNTISNR